MSAPDIKALVRARGSKRKVVKRSAAKEYAGLLAQPMFPLHALSTATDESFWVMKRVFKTVLLFQHFDIDPNGRDAWQNLAIALAERHVPGFKPPPQKQGRPRERVNDDITLFLLIELLKRRDGVSDRAAIKKIAARKILNGAFETLRTRYQRAKRDKHLGVLLKTIGGSVSNEQLVDALESGVGALLCPAGQENPGFENN
jgi:hypothetical protein